jgi:hypothetical protein
MKDEGAAAAGGAGAEAGGAGALLRNNLLMNALWSIVGGQRQHVSASALWGHACCGRGPAGCSYPLELCAPQASGRRPR